MNLGLVFLTGLTTGGITCVALQGGLLASSLANTQDADQQRSPRESAVLIVAFLVAKLLSHVLLGGLLGWIGGRADLDLGWRLFFQTAAALYMLATAANLVNLHPIFRYVVLQPPRWTSRLLRSSRGNWFSPALLGFLTVLIPCGVTQSMEVQAVTSGNALQGALIMGAFVLGTAPVFALVGIASETALHGWKRLLTRVSVALLVLLSLSSLNGVLTVLDSPLTVQKVGYELAAFGRPPSWYGTDGATITQNLKLQVTNNGYFPKRLRARVGEEVTLTLESNETYSCASLFVLPAFQIRLQLLPTDNKTVSFTPTKRGNYTFTCGMGMYSGILEVI